MHHLHGTIPHTHSNSKAMDMTSGSISRLLLAFALPLLLGNLFQQLYNTVDSLVVGNFVGTEALAAVGSTTSIINTMVSFFNGVSIGAGVVIGQNYGAHDEKQLHLAIETTMAITFAGSLALTAVGVLMVPAMLRFMSTPDDVMESASVYLRIYFSGVSGLLVYNMGSGILRAVGDTKRPLMFLCFSSFLNIGLDLLFVIIFHLGIAGVGYATIIAQFLSAALILLLLTKSTDVYRFSWKDLCVKKDILKQILIVGLPTGLQQALTSFSNVFVQSYINSFGSGCMAGWSCYTKIDQFIMLPLRSMGQASTTFVSQNIGARDIPRSKKGTATALVMALCQRSPSLALCPLDGAAVQQRIGSGPLRSPVPEDVRILHAVQLRQSGSGRSAQRHRQRQSSHDHHALLFCGVPPDLPADRHQDLRHGSRGRFRLSGRMDRQCRPYDCLLSVQRLGEKASFLTRSVSKKERLL